MSTNSEPRRRVLFQLSGSIAAYKACHVVSRLVQAGCEVQTVATGAALRFVGAATLEGLSGRPVATDTFADGRAMDHINLVRWADAVVLCPATANTLNRLAAGVADNLIGTMFLAHDFSKPYLVAPAMNTAMFAHPATQRSIDALRGFGVEFIEPDAGSLACGEIGAGRLADPDAVVATVLGALERLSDAPPDSVASRRIVITSGGTTVPIDGVRAITNTSTGRTGAAIAEHFAGGGHHVTLLHATDAALPETAERIDLVPFHTFGDLDRALRDTLPTAAADAVIHLAAVSDFDIDRLELDGVSVVPSIAGKVDSGDRLVIDLVRTPKLIASLRELAGQRAVIVGFKYTNGLDEPACTAAVASVARYADVVVHNDATTLAAERAAGGGIRTATLYEAGADGDVDLVATVNSDSELAAALRAAIERHLSAATAETA